MLASLLITATLSAQVTFKKNYGGAIPSAGYAVNQCYDSGYIATGLSSSGGYGVFLVRTDAYGNTLWEKRYTNLQNMLGFDVIQTRDSNFIVSGYIDSGHGYGLLIKIDQNGDTLWEKHYNTSYHWIQSVAEGYDGSLFCGGGSFFKTDPSGTVLWDVAPYGQIMYVLPTSDSCFVTVGFDLTTIYLRKVSLSGSVIWSKMFQGTLHNASNNCVGETSDGGYIVTGLLSSGTGTLLIRTDANGDSLWTRNYPVADWGNAVVQSGDGGFAIAGKAPDGQMMLLKTDFAGNLICYDTLGGVAEGAKSIQETTDHGFILCGVDTGLYLVKADSVSNCVDVGFQDLQQELISALLFFPNPFSSGTTLQLNSYLDGLSLVIYNALGQEIKFMNNLTGTSIHIQRGNLQEGIYFAELRHDGKRIGICKLVVSY